LWAFGFGLLHMLYYLDETGWVNGARSSWLQWPMQLYLALGLLGFTILAVLALTSNRWSMRRLGKQWKRLHRLVYIAAMTVVFHALLATTMSKKVLLRDPHAVSELQVYLAVLALLLVVRLPLVRRPLQPMLALQRPQPQTTQPVAPRVLPGRALPHSPTLSTHSSIHTPIPTHTHVPTHKHILTHKGQVPLSDQGTPRQSAEEVETPPFPTPLSHTSRPSFNPEQQRERTYS
jgi:hypothetical protein